MSKISVMTDADELQAGDFLEVAQLRDGIWTSKRLDTDNLGGGGGAVQGYLADRAAPLEATVWADEFDGAALDPAWTTMAGSGSLDVKVGRGACSMLFDAQADSYMVGIGRSLPAALPAVYGIETAYRVHTMRANFLFAGPFISEGVLSTSKVAWWMPYWAHGGFYDSFRGGTVASVTAWYTDVARYPYGSMGTDVLLFRLVVDTTDSTIRVERSLDGVQWALAGSTAFDGALTLTPSHFGFGVSTWGGNAGAAWDRLASVDYMRIYDLTP